MNVLHIDSESGWRGGEQQAWWLVEGLLRRGAGKQTVVAPAGSEFARRARAAGWDAVGIPMRGGWDFAAARRIGELVRERSIDLVHAHTAHAHNLAWLGVARPGIVPVVVTRRVDFPIARPGALGYFRRLKYVHPGVHLIAISSGVRDAMTRGGVPSERVAIVPSGIDTARLDGPRDPGKIRALLDADAATAVIGNVAALTDHKGQIYLVSAAAEIRRWFREEAPKIPDFAYKDFRIAIAGEGEERPRLEEEIQRLDLARHVRLLGWRDDVPDCLAAFDIFCLPSHLEGLGTAMLDAMWMSLPVVASRTGGIPDVIADGGNGLLVPPRDPKALADALVRCVGDGALRARLAAAGRRTVEERFTADSMIEGTLGVYRQVLAKLER